jgi:hypothetical protein
MGKVATILALVAIVAAIGAVNTLTSMSLVQEAQADACNFNFKNQISKCSPGGPNGVSGDLNQHFHTD